MATQMRTLIVDDEPLARERVKNLVLQQPDLELVGECGDGEEALEAIHRHKPDLVFLDIQMPGMDGFELVSALDSDVLPAIIFVTAYDQFAIKAFEVHAIDYLLKPFDDDRFAAALERARLWRQRSVPGEEWGAKLQALLADVRPSVRSVNRLAVKSGGRVLLLRVKDIDWVEAADNYVSLHVGDEAHLLRETMGSLEKRLPAEQFIRISRSTIVNLDRVQELQPLFHGEYAVILRDGVKVTLSRSYRDKLDQLLGKDAG